MAQRPTVFEAFSVGLGEDLAALQTHSGQRLPLGTVRHNLVDAVVAAVGLGAVAAAEVCGEIVDNATALSIRQIGVPLSPETLDVIERRRRLLIADVVAIELRRAAA